MSNELNFPAPLRLDVESALCLSLCRAFWMGFPAPLRARARIKTTRLHLAIDSMEIGAYDLMAGAYLGFTPFTSGYRRFTNEAKRLNEVTFNPPEFAENAVLRENSASRDYGISRGELKRLYHFLDAFAQKFAGIPSYKEFFNCGDVILNDQSPFAPEDRETFTAGPLYLWDLAKAVEEHEICDMAFGTFRGWVLFLHRIGNTVLGQAVHPAALRFGDFKYNPLINIDPFLRDPGPHPILDIPEEVRAAGIELGARRFPDQPLQFVNPPIVLMGRVYGSQPAILDLRQSRTEA